MAYENSREELEAFKQHPIADLATQLGWEIDESARDRGKNSATLAKGGESIVTFKGSSCWMFKRLAGGKAGTIVDLAIEEAGSLGAARKLLRELTSTSVETSTTISSSTRPDTAPSPDDLKRKHAEILQRWKTMRRLESDEIPPFMRERGITRIASHIRAQLRINTENKWQNVAYLYSFGIGGGEYLAAGIEEKNRGVKGIYTKGGCGGVWFARGDAGAPIVVVESVVDAISFDAISDVAREHREAGRSLSYVAIRSGGEKTCAALIMRENLENNAAPVILACDNDAAGVAYHAKIWPDIAVKGGPDVYQMVPPDFHEDWNDALQAQSARETQYMSGPELTPA